MLVPYLATSLAPVLLVIVPPVIVAPDKLVLAPIVNTPPFKTTEFVMVLPLPPFKTTLSALLVDVIGALTTIPVTAFMVNVAAAPVVFAIALATVIEPSGVVTVASVPVFRVVTSDVAAAASIVMSVGSISHRPFLPNGAEALTVAPAKLTLGAEVSINPPSPPLAPAFASSVPLNPQP